MARKATCRVKGCDELVYAKGLCKRDYFKEYNRPTDSDPDVIVHNVFHLDMDELDRAIQDVLRMDQASNVKVELLRMIKDRRAELLSIADSSEIVEEIENEDIPEAL